MAKVEDVADIIVNWMNAQVEPYISNLMLNKLLYFAQGHCLAELDEPLFDDDFEAWKYGPVIPKIYHEYKKYDNNNIVATKQPNYNSLSNDQLSLLGTVLEQYGDYSPHKLVNITHEANSPWDIAKNQKLKNARNIISKSEISSYFKNVELKDFNEEEDYNYNEISNILNDYENRNLELLTLDEMKKSYELAD